MSWNSDDLSNYNRADSPSYSIQPNGKVDINPLQGSIDYRIGLSSDGMFKLVNEWLDSSGLNNEKKEQLIAKINK